MRIVLACFCLVAAVQGAAAQQWQSAGKGEGARAFFSQGGKPAGIEIACRSGGRLAITAAGNGARFPADRPATLVLSIDGMAFSGEARVESEPRGGGSRFVRETDAGEASALLSALKRGKSLEVSSLAGFMRLPLGGSGRALGAFGAACGAP